MNARKWVRADVSLLEGGKTDVFTVDITTGDALPALEDPTTSEQIYYLNPHENTPKLVKQSPSTYDSTNVVTNQYHAISTDGTRIPYFVVARTAVLKNGPAPTIQSGYGGFGILTKANYLAVVGKLWLKKGGAICYSECTWWWRIQSGLVSRCRRQESATSI